MQVIWHLRKLHKECFITRINWFSTILQDDFTGIPSSPLRLSYCFAFFLFFNGFITNFCLMTQLLLKLVNSHYCLAKTIGNTTNLSMRLVVAKWLQTDWKSKRLKKLQNDTIDGNCMLYQIHSCIKNNFNSCETIFQKLHMMLL